MRREVGLGLSDVLHENGFGCVDAEALGQLDEFEFVVELI